MCRSGGRGRQQVIRIEGEQRKFDFSPLPHWELGERLGIIDFERGVKLSGTRFYVLMGLGARLERALIDWMLDLKREQGYLEIAPPLMVNRATVIQTGHLTKFGEQHVPRCGGRLLVYSDRGGASHQLYADEILEAERLPINLAPTLHVFAAKRCRRGATFVELSAAISSTRSRWSSWFGRKLPTLNLMHWSRMPARSAAVSRFPFESCSLCTADLGFASAATYDIEMWAPGLGEWLEVSSCSNCTDFQMRRSNIRFRPQKGGKTEFLHALNGSGLGLPRTLIAVLENYQQADGSIVIPEVLRPYMGGALTIGPSSHNCD